MRVRLRKEGTVDVEPVETIVELFEIAQPVRFRPSQEGNNQVDYLAKGIGEEAGEILGVLKKMDRGDPDADNDWLTEEMADLMYYVMRMCRAKGIDPTTIGGVLRAKLEAYKRRTDG